MTISLADVVTRICRRAGLTDIDVTDLEEVYIEGYVLSRVMSAREALDPLRMAGFFDIVESGSVLKFVTRGKPLVRRIEPQSLGARSEGSDDAQNVKTKMSQDAELPRQIRLHYRDVGKEYQDGEQLSPVRLNTSAVNDIDIELSIALTGTQAAQIAEVLWADAWNNRWSHTFSLGAETACDLDPADCIEVPVDGEYQRMLILTIEADIPCVYKIEATRDDDGVYESSAVALDVGYDSVLVSYAGTNLVFLDLPPLRPVDTGAGYYVAAAGITSALYGGTSIFRSVDNGATYELTQSVAGEATIGTVNAVPAPPPGTTYDVFDTSTVIRVTIPEDHELSSIPDSMIDSGANTIAFGADGRWEVAQFTNAAQVNSTQWDLSRLLRGRRGTEHVWGTSQAGDTFVLLSGAGITRLPLDNIFIGEARQFRAVTIGLSYADGLNYEFTGNGEALRPFSPTGVEVEVQTNGDWLITWTRRDRFGQEFVDGGTPPMSEASESYEIDIVTLGSPTVVLRTLTSSEASVTYTSAQQLDDDVISGTQILVNVYQMSAVVGRGTVGSVATADPGSPASSLVVQAVLTNSGSPTTSTWYARVGAALDSAEGAESIDGDSFNVIRPAGQYGYNDLVVGPSSRYFATRGNQLGRSGSTDLYGAWTWVNVDDFPLRGINAGVTWTSLRYLNGTMYAWSSSIIVEWNGSSWEETGIPTLDGVALDDYEDFVIVDLLWDAVNSRFLIFGQYRDEPSPGTVYFRPRVYRSTDLNAWILQEDLATNPTTDNMTITGVAVAGTTIVATMRNNTSTVTGHLARSTDNGSTWTFPSITWPTTTPPWNPSNVVYDGAQFLAGGLDWVGRSPTGESWTFEQLIFGVGELFSPLYTDGRGTTVANVSTSSSIGAAFTRDGINWERSGSTSGAANISGSSSLTFTASGNIKSRRRISGATTLTFTTSGNLTGD